MTDREWNWCPVAVRQRTLEPESRVPKQNLCQDKRKLAQNQIPGRKSLFQRTLVLAFWLLLNGSGNEFTKHICYLLIQMCFTRSRSMGEIGHQRVQAPLAAAISHWRFHLIHEWMKWDLTITSGVRWPTLLRIVCGFFYYVSLDCVNLEGLSDGVYGL